MSSSVGSGMATEGSGKALLVPAQQIFANEVCMIASNALLRMQANNNNAANANKSNGLFNTSAAPERYQVVIAPNGVGPVYANSFEFAGVGNTMAGLRKGEETPNCGFVSWASIAGADCKGEATQEGQNTCQYAKNALSQMVYQLLPAAQRYVCKSELGIQLPECAGAAGLDPTQSNSESFFAALIDYMQAVKPVAKTSTRGCSQCQKFY